MGHLARIMNFETGKVIWGIPGWAAQAVVGARYTYLTASTASIGTTNEDSLVVVDDGTCALTFNGVKNVDIGVTGAGGLQTGSTEAASTWYGVYVIGDTSIQNAVNILLIPDGTAFSESGYDVKKLVGWIRNDASGNFMETTQTGGGNARYHEYNIPISDRKPLEGGSATALTEVDCSSLVPPGCRRGQIQIGFETGSAGAADDKMHIMEGSTSDLQRLMNGFVGTLKVLSTFDINFSADRKLEYKLTTGGVNENRTDININGYTHYL